MQATVRQSYPPPPVGHKDSFFAKVEPPLYNVGKGATDTNACSNIGMLSRFNVYHCANGKFYNVPEGDAFQLEQIDTTDGFFGLYGSCLIILRKRKKTIQRRPSTL